MGGRYHSSGRATVDGLGVLHDLLERARGEHPEVEPLDLAMLETALIEIVGNVVEHGMPPGGLHYEFWLEVSGDELRGLLVETGDPVVVEPHDLAGDGLAESGRGLPLARAALTDFRYERRSDGTNAWTMTRQLTGRGDGAH